MSLDRKDRKVIARISWLSAEEGGRRHPPKGPSYSTVARFENDDGNWPNEAWSIVAEFEQPVDSSSVIAEIRFLAPKGPSHLLDPGRKFELFEGRSLVARGEVLKEVPTTPAKRGRPHATVTVSEPR